MPPKKDPPSCSESERLLFLRAMGAPQAPKHEIVEKPKEVAQKSPRKESENVSSNEDESALFLQLLQESLDHHPELIQKRNDLHGPKLQKPKAAPRPSGPEASIDLHACSLEVALTRTEEFLLRCHVKKMRKVLVIHGKGSGILKEGVRKYLMHHPHVSDLQDAERQHGGSGAAIVSLKR